MTAYVCDRCGKDSARGLLTMVPDFPAPDVAFAHRAQRCCFDCHTQRMAEFWTVVRSKEGVSP